MSTARIQMIDDGYKQLISSFPLVPIRNKKQFEKAVTVMKDLAYRRASLSHGEADYLSVLASLIAQYEKRLPRLAAKMTPSEALKHLLEINGLTQAALVPLVGHKSNLSAFLSGKRGLSKQAALRLAERFKVSPALFLG